MNNQGGASIRRKALSIFYSQWAFGERGLSARVGEQAPPYAGSGIRVGIFDTSPFPVTISNADFQLEPNLHLTLSHPIPGGITGGCGSGPAADHGLFVAGLIHALAPYSDIHLIRVLDDAAQGVMSVLLAALAQFIREVNDDGMLRGAVINLSLGLTDSEGDTATGPASLRLLLEVAYALNIIVVAAAGNDSAPIAGSHGPQVPAAWDFVIGVAACNAQRELACFANTGDIMAPGGGGIAPYCLPGLNKCYGVDCRYALISLSTTSWTGFSYGVGSSFAAPLISGLVANIQSRDSWLPCAEIKQKILHNAVDGVIDAEGIY
jgi:subtilisin family serine protease